MTTIANLSVRIGADIGDLKSKMTAAQRSVNTLGEKLTSVGKALSVGLTVPLGLAGAAAVSAAAQMDSLTRGLTAVSGSAQATQAQLERLNEVAKLPGLGFREAIQGSISLQAAGFSAEQAEASLRAFGNALAIVGKGKADLDGVTIALSQIAAKGKVSAEEINQLQERVPQIRQAMKAAFGTADTEVLQKAGVSANEFVDRVVAELNRLPQATGGPANAFENLSDSIFRLRVAIGNGLLPVITPLIERLARMAEAAAKVDPAVTRSRIALAAVVALGGPLAVAIGSVTTAVTSLAAALSVGLLPLIVVGAPVMLALAALAKQFIEDGLRAADAASKIDQFRQSLARLGDFDIAQTLGKKRELEAKIDLLKSAQDELAKLDARAKRSRDLFGGAARADLGIQPTEVGGLSPADKSRRDKLREVVDSMPSLKELNDDLAKVDKHLSDIQDQPVKPIEDPFQLVTKGSGKVLTALEQQAALVDRIAAAYEGLSARQQDTGDILARALSLNDQIEAALRRQTDAASATANELRKQQDTLLQSIPLLQKMADLRAEMATTPLVTTPPNLTPVPVATVPVVAPVAQEGLLSKLLGGTVGQLAAQFGPLALAAAALRPVFEGLRDVLGPVLSKLAAPLESIGRVLGSTLVPILDALAEPLALLGRLVEALLQPFAASIRIIVAYITPALKIFGAVVRGITTAISYVVEGIGVFVRAVGKIIDKIPFVSGGPIIRAGQQLIDGARAARRPLEDLADTAEKLNEALINVVQGFKVERFRFAATNAPLVYAPPPPAPPGSSPGTPGGGGVNVNVNVHGGAGPAGTDRKATYRAFYEQFDQQSRGDPTARELFLSFPAPALA